MDGTGSGHCAGQSEAVKPEARAHGIGPIRLAAWGSYQVFCNLQLPWDGELAAGCRRNGTGP